MREKHKETKQLKVTFINSNSNNDLEKLLRTVIIEKIKNSNEYRAGTQ